MYVVVIKTPERVLYETAQLKQYRANEIALALEQRARELEFNVKILVRQEV